MKKLMVMILLMGCTSKEVKPTLKAPIVPMTIAKEDTIELVPIVMVEAKNRVSPTYAFKGRMPSDLYIQAVNFILQYANSDEFIEYLSRRDHFSHVGNKTAQEVIAEWRDQLDRQDVMYISYYTPWFSDRIGGWDGETIRQNTKYLEKLTVAERAGHLLHETAHKYGWVHEGNYTNENDNVNSFPYAVGYDFEDFILKKTGNLAGK
jgi:hypothetical protein